MSTHTDRVTSGQARKKMPFFIHRNFALVWTGGLISGFGDAVFNTTLVLWIATGIARGQSWAPLAVSGILIATSIPVFALGPFAGVFADRWAKKRRVMMLMDAVRAVLILPLLLILLLPSLKQGQAFLFWQFIAYIYCCAPFKSL